VRVSPIWRMKKMKKKLFGLFCIFLLGIYFVNLGIVRASDDDIPVNTEEYPDYIPDIDPWVKIDGDDTIFYCEELGKLWPTDGFYYTKSYANEDRGLAYILDKGYTGGSTPTITDSIEKDRYITQGAIWLYLNGSISSDFENASDPYGLKAYMTTLVNEAREVSNGTRSYSSTKSTSISIDINDTDLTYSNNNYISEIITPTITNASTYTVTASGADNIKIIDENGTERSTFNVGEGFRVSIPSESVNNYASVYIDITVEGIITFANVYTPSTSMENGADYQNIIARDSKEGTITTSFTLSATHEEVCVNYMIVGDSTPDPSKTDSTPETTCITKGDTYTEEGGLNTTDNCTFNGWYTNSSLTEKWTNGNALNDNLTLYGSWDCSTVPVDDTLARTPFIILGLGLIVISIGTTLYLVNEKKKIKE